MTTIRSLLLTFVLAISALSTPQQANAGLIVGNGNLAGTGVLFMLLGAAIDEPGADTGDGIFTLGLVFLILEENEQTMQDEISNRFARIPAFAAQDAAKAFMEQARLTKKDSRGLKSLALPKKVAQEIDESIAYIDQDLRSQFFKFMTKKADI